MAEKKANDRNDWIRDAFRRYEGPLVRYAAGLLRDVDAARDVVQDAFVKLCRVDRRKVQENVSPGCSRFADGERSMYCGNETERAAALNAPMSRPRANRIRRINWRSASKRNRCSPS